MVDVLKGGVSITYFGHSAFKFETRAGKVILIDPWLDNPLASEDKTGVDHVDMVLVTHGHQDHLGSTLEVCSKTGAKAIAIYEIIHYLSGKGVNNVIGMNLGGTLREGEITITMVPAFHSSSIDDNGRILYAGDATGFVIRVESGFTVYHTGDTAVFQDMGLIREIYRPDLALVPIGGLYVMGPLEAVCACRLIQPRFVIPMHYGTLPGLTGTPREFEELMKTVPNTEVIMMHSGQTLT